MTVCGIGVDIVEIERIRRAIERFGERFLQRIYTAREIAYCTSFQDPYPHFAVRFAAKEAAMKALGVGLWSGIPWRDYEVINLDSGEPRMRLSGKAQERAQQRGVRRVWISLSHHRTSAVAVVVMEGTPNVPP